MTFTYEHLSYDIHLIIMQKGLFFSKRNVTILFNERNDYPVQKSAMLIWKSIKHRSVNTRFDKSENRMQSIVTFILKLRRRYWKFHIRNCYWTGMMKKKYKNECVQLTDEVHSCIVIKIVVTKMNPMFVKIYTKREITITHFYKCPCLETVNF